MPILFYLTCKCLWISSHYFFLKLFRSYKSPPVYTVIRIYLISLSYHILVFAITCISMHEANVNVAVNVTCIGHAKLELFTDDVKLYSSSNYDVLNLGDLQQSIDLLPSWAMYWQLKINISKWSVLSIHPKSKSMIPHPYFINGSQHTNTSSVTGLAILVDSRSTFNFLVGNILAQTTNKLVSLAWIFITLFCP